MKHRFLNIAEVEMFEAALYFESESKGLGFEFLEEADHCIEQIKSFPHAWPEVRPGIRKHLTRRFPYSLLYSIRENNTILIIAVMHCKKIPEYWIDRL